MPKNYWRKNIVMKWEEMMSNFIGMVFATLKKEGIDTSKMDTSEAIAKYNEIKGSDGGSNTKGEETSKQEEKTAETGKETVKKTDAEKDSVTTEKDSTVETVAKKEAVENAGNNQLKDIESMTRIELAKELYQSYLKTGSKPIGSDKPLTEQQYVKRYLSGIGSSSGFSKQALQDLVQKARNGKYGGSDINKQAISNSPNTAEKMSTAMGISPDEAKAFASGKGHLSQDGGYNGVSNVKSAPKFEYKSNTGYEKVRSEKIQELMSYGYSQEESEQAFEASVDFWQKQLKCDRETAMKIVAKDRG